MAQPAYNQPDELLHISLMDGQARVILASTRALTQEAADIHETSPVCTAALGRLMTGAILMAGGGGECIDLDWVITNILIVWR